MPRRLRAIRVKVLGRPGEQASALLKGGFPGDDHEPSGAKGEGMASDLAVPLTAFSFSAMPLEELAERHRELTGRIRDVDHWRRLVCARLDLAVAAVADLDEPGGRDPELSCPALPPEGLRALLGISCTPAARLRETALLPGLRMALHELDVYATALHAIADEAGHMLAVRLRATWPDELPDQLPGRLPD